MKLRPFSRVLIANRGEIAVRIIRACREQNIEVAVVYSEADASALHVRLADDSRCIGPAPSSESYLVPEALLAAGREMSCDAVHPGYGFLSENADFAEAVLDEGWVWIGPPAEAIRVMGSKTGARQFMDRAGVPLVPGTLEATPSAAQGLSLAEEMGFPVMIKAVSGGGGKGMRLVHAPADFVDAFDSATSEAQKSFNDPAVYIEKAIINPRHVEIQVLADGHGNVVHLFERDCSIQRRHQKVVEEAPCPVLTSETREAMAVAAIQATRAVDYVGAGTCEFLLAQTGEFYFLEMNTRLQVEHPITEAISGVDLVQAQLRVASGEPLWFQQSDLRIHGHAIECRIYAEDVSEGFRPSPGPLLGYREPGGLGVRVDSGVCEGMEVSVYYDPMIAKLVVWGATREQAIARSKRALAEYQIVGLPTSIPFFQAVFNSEAFLSGHYHTGYISPAWLKENIVLKDETQEWAVIAAAIARYERDKERQPSVQTGALSPWKRASRWNEQGRGN